ncbi:MAG: ribonuclease H-like domain-containing protein [Patescibacteria group bacterium]|nr:ribonuclease H-like domain-containing protein [Patescibacteria group bacterium]
MSATNSAPEKSGDKIVLDLETKKTFEEVGGQHNRHLLGVSLVGVYSYNKDKYRGFKEEEFGELLELIKNSKLIIGFNSKSFDFTVLQPYFKDFDLFSINHLDILEEVVYALGHRLKLETIAQSTLGHGKSGEGLDAIYYYKQGDWDSLIKYCLDDVKVTKEIYDYGREHGHIWYQNAGRKEKIMARWANGNGKTIAEKIKEALKDGQQLEIEYMDEAGNDSVRKIDIQRIYDGKVKAYCHLRGAVRVFDIDKIKKAQAVGQMSSWQKTLI